MNVPPGLAELLAGRPLVGAQEQAFPFLTVDDDGFPHVALLSRAEMEMGGNGREILAVIASPGTCHNVLRDGRAAFIAIGGTSAHYTKLILRRTLEAEGFLCCAFEVTHHKADSLGIPIDPIRFPASTVVAEVERWEVTERLLAQLAQT
jgi:hypothetical protein